MSRHSMSVHPCLILALILVTSCRGTGNATIDNVTVRQIPLEWSEPDTAYSKTNAMAYVNDSTFVISKFYPGDYEHAETFFCRIEGKTITPIGNRNFIGSICEYVEACNGVTYASIENRTHSGNEICIISLKDNAKEWNTLYRSKPDEYNLLYSFKVFDEKHLAFYAKLAGTSRVIYTSDGGQNWKDLYLDVKHMSNHDLVMTDSAITYLGDKGGYSAIVQHKLPDLLPDTLCLISQSIKNLTTKIVRGDDIIGLWIGHRASYYQIQGDTIRYLSSIRFGKRTQNHIPRSIYQYGDIVYTKVQNLTFNAESHDYISFDRARTWHPASDGCPEAGLGFPFVGNKDQVIRITRDQESDRECLRIISPRYPE